MSEEPIRLKDSEDAPEALRRILRDANDISPMPPEVRASVLADLPQAAPASSLASPAVVGGAALGAAIVAALLWQGRSVPALETRAPSPTVAVSTPTEAPPAPTLSATTEPIASAADTSAAPRPVVSSRLPEPKLERDTLAVESALIGRARSNLVANPKTALTAIDEHAHRFPRGELAPEREYLRVSALHRLGRDDEAKARGRTYTTTYGSSPYAPAVRKLIAEIDGR